MEQQAPSPGRLIWSADMDGEGLAEWERGGGGGEFNSGLAEAAVSRNEAHSGRRAAQLTITTPPESGARLFRWNESRRFRDLYYEAWFYVPHPYQLTADPATGRYWDIFQFKSTGTDGTNDPLWFLGLTNRADGELVPELIWWHRTLEGPHANEAGYRVFPTADVTIPVGRWFAIRARLRQSKDFDGIVQFWLDGEKIFDLRGVRTGYANCTHNTWCVDQAWSVNLYSDGLSPAPSVVYVDTARIWRVRQDRLPSHHRPSI